MKRTDYITIMVCLLAIGVAYAVIRWPRTVPYEQCSEVYKQYCEKGGVSAAYIKDFKVNDTLTVGVTLLEATTDSGWMMLKEDFGIGASPQEIGDTVHSVGFKLVPTKDTNSSMPMDICSFSRHERSVCVFHTSDTFLYESILYLFITNMSKIN